MPIPVEQLPAFLRDLAKGLKEGQCLAAKEGANFVFDKDSISVEIEVIAAGGLNKIERRARQESGEKISEETRPEIVTESIQSPYTKTQTAKPATSTTTATDNNPETTSTQTQGAETTNSTNTQSTPDNTQTSKSTVNSTNTSLNQGGDRINTEYKIESS